MSKTLTAKIRDGLQARAKARAEGVSIEEFLASREGVSLDDRDAILRTLDGIDAAAREIREAGDRDVWVTQTIDASRGGLSSRDAQLLAGAEVGDGVMSATLAREAHERVTAALVTGLAAGEVDGALDGEVVDLVEAASFFDRELGHPDDRDTTATLAAAILPAMRAAEPSVHAEAVAAAVDVGVQTAKATAKAAGGEVPLDAAASHVLERVAAAIGTVIRVAAPRFAEAGGAWIGAAVGQLVGLAPVGAQVGRALGRVAGHAVAEVLGSGVASMVKELGRVASRIASQATEVVVGAARRFAAALGL